MNGYFTDLATRVRAHCLRVWVAAARLQVHRILTDWEARR